MLWEIVKFYLLMDLAGFLTSVLVISAKETKYAIKTEDETRLCKFCDYLHKDGFLKKRTWSIKDWIIDIAKWIGYGYLLGFQMLNEYYNFLAEDAEQKEKA